MFHLSCGAVLKRMYEKNKVTMDEEIHQRLKDEATEKAKQAEYVCTVQHCFRRYACLEWPVNVCVCVFQVSEDAKVRGTCN